MMSFQERRRHLRIFGSIPLKISGDDFDMVSETTNLSCSGTYCRVNKYIEPMTKLKVQLLLPFKQKNGTVTKKISCHGVIVRTESMKNEDAYNVAIFFNDIQARDSERLAEYVRLALNKESATPAPQSPR